MSTQVLFVCTGNICRSPFAELLARHLVDQLPEGHPHRDWTFSSAGVGGLEGWDMEELMSAELRARGVSPDGFKARYLTAEIVRSADLLLVMEPTHRSHILDEWPELVRRTWLLGHAARVLPGLEPQDTLEALRADRSRASRRDSIADPYTRGLEAASVAASQVEAALRIVLGA